MNSTRYTVDKLRAVGFAFPQLEHTCNVGNVYGYNGETYTIGGKWGNSSYTEQEKTIAKEGTWLPNEDDLMRWLELTHHSVQIHYSADERYFHGTATNANGTVFVGSGPTLLCCLEKLIYKICKQSKTPVIPDTIEILEIEE